MRCLTLADTLRARGASCSFFCRPHSGHLLNMISQRGHHAVSLPGLAARWIRLPAEPAHAAWLGTDWQTDAQQTREAFCGKSFDWLVVDHYALDYRWEHALRPHSQKLMVIDDLADRPHDCELLLDQNLGRSANDYGGLLNPDTTTLIGPQYALINSEFAKLRNYSLARRANPQLKHLLITMGGVDKDNVTTQVLQTLRSCHLHADLRITVVMGPNAPNLSAVKEQVAQMPWTTKMLVGVDNMAQLMGESDLCIGAAGSTSWERCCLGLPTLLLAQAENQRPGAIALAQAGAVYPLNSVEDLSQALEKFMPSSDTSHIRRTSQASAAVSDGLGAQRIVTAILSQQLHA